MDLHNFFTCIPTKVALQYYNTAKYKIVITFWNGFTPLPKHVGHCRDHCVVEFDVWSRTVVPIVVDQGGSCGKLTSLYLTRSLYREQSHRAGDRDKALCTM